MPDMNLEPGCDTCEHIADVRGITLTNTHWFTKSAVDELTAGLRATLEARTAALTRTIARAEKAEAERDNMRARLRNPERHLGSLLETIDSECDTTGPVCHEHDLTESGECALAADLALILNEIRAVLEGGR